MASRAADHRASGASGTFRRYVNRGKRKKAEEHAQYATPAGAVEIPPPPGSSILEQRWAELIKKVYAADPLVCP